MLRAALLLVAVVGHCAVTTASPLHRPIPPVISATGGDPKIRSLWDRTVAAVRSGGGEVHPSVALASFESQDDGGLPWTVTVADHVRAGERVARVPLDLWITPRTVLESKLGAWLAEHFPALLQMPAIVGEVYALYVMWCASGSPTTTTSGDGGEDGCASHRALVDLVFSLEVPGSPLGLPEHRLRTLLEYHTSLSQVVDHDRSLHDSVWAEVEEHVLPAERAMFRGVGEMGKAVFDRVTAVARALAQPVDPASRTPVEGIAPVIGFMRHGVAAAVDEAGRALADQVRAFRTVHFEGARIVDAEFGLTKGDQVLLDRGSLRPDQFLTQYGHVPSDAAVRSSITLEPVFTGKSESLRIAKTKAYADLFGGKVEPVTLDLSGRLGLAARAFYRIESCENATEVASAARATRAFETTGSPPSDKKGDSGGDGIGGNGSSGDGLSIADHDRRMRGRVRSSIRAVLRLRPNVDFDSELVYERELLGRAEREVIRVRSAENAVLVATLTAALEEGESMPAKVWWDQHSATPAVRFEATAE